MSDLRHLDNRERRENLKRLRPLGSWERDELDREQGRKAMRPMPPPATPAAVNHKNTSTKKEGKMATDKGIGICTLCNQEKTMRQVKGKKYCATCLSITSVVANHWPLLVKAMQLAGLMVDNTEGGTVVDPVAEAERLQGENERLFSVIEGLEEEKTGLSRQLEECQAVSAVNDAPDRQGLNAELAALRARLVRRLQAMTAENKRLGSVIKGQEEKISRFKEYNNNQGDMLKDLRSDKLALTGELEGLQDVLASQEGERTTMAAENVRLVEEVRFLYKQLGKTERESDDLAEKCKRLQAMQAGAMKKDVYALTDPDGGPEVPDAYSSLHGVLMDALEQASCGKGLERHATPGESFDRQKICEITRRVGLGYPLGQAIKKAEEAQRLGDRGPAEILGAINYLAAACICMREQQPAEPFHVAGLHGLRLEE